MKEWNVIHKIKGLYGSGRGLSIRAIANAFGMSRNIVRKYLRLDEVSISRQLKNPSRSKYLDLYRDYIKSQRVKFPSLSSVKIMRKLQEKIPDLDISNRTVRRYAEKGARRELIYCLVVLLACLDRYE
ncbi:MAG: hypothetical protein JKY01_13460 [Pseudomonadales bacterium]|nr:hypothetical protein [Pseudomonadales bacterium]